MNIQTVPDVNTGGGSVVGTTADCGVEGCSMGLMCSSGEMRDRVVGEYESGGGRDSPTDFVGLNEARISPLGRVQSVGRV